MNINIKKNSKKSIYMQIYSQIKNKILSRKLDNGMFLPSERSLADKLSINRSTVINAYDLLKSDGLIKTIKGKGTFVSYEVFQTDNEQIIKTQYDWSGCFEENMNTAYNEVIQLIMDSNHRDGKIFMAGGLPSPELTPIDEFHSIYEELVINKRIDSFSHSSVLGVNELRKEIRKIMKKRGINTNIDELLITSGSQQGLDLMIRSFVKKDDVVIVEDPSFFGALQLFHHVGAKIVTVPMEDDGMDIEALEHFIIKHKAKMIYTVPTFHNPTGIVMSYEKRKKLLELSNKYRIPVIEDDPYGEIYFDNQEIPTLKEMDSSNYVIYLSTFSKTITLGLRIGWICASYEAINCLKKIKQISDLHVNTLNQYVIARYISSGKYELHLEKIRKEYLLKRNLMIDALNEHFKDIEFNISSGGYYIWIGFNTDISIRKLFKETYKNGVVITPGFYFQAKGKQSTSSIRLNYTYPKANEIYKGIEIIKACYKKIIEEENIK